MRDRTVELSRRWRRRGHHLALGIGIAVGYATCGEIGFEAPITQLFEQLFAQAADHGLADLDHSALFVELASRNGMT